MLHITFVDFAPWAPGTNNSISYCQHCIHTHHTHQTQHTQHKQFQKCVQCPRGWGQEGVQGTLNSPRILPFLWIAPGVGGRRGSRGHWFLLEFFPFCELEESALADNFFNLLNLNLFLNSSIPASGRIPWSSNISNLHSISIMSFISPTFPIQETFA